MNVLVDILGQKFGRLVVYKRAKKGSDSRACWWCKCECGNRLKVAGKDLRLGHTKSCGCLQKEKAGFERRKPGVAARQLFAKTAGRAKKRNRAFELAFAEFFRLSALPCFYCGRDFFSTNRCKWDEFRYNGLDRVDSTKGYTPDNIVPCCKLCNIMKADLSVEMFVEQIERIYATHLLRSAHEKT